METRRRHLLTEPGNTLLLAESAIDNAYRFTDWVEATGLDSSRTVVGGMCSVPLPVYTATAPGRRQFSEVRPEMMWHPLFWLPARLAYRYDGLPIGEGGAPEFEPVDLWSIRVGLELSVSGLYDPEEGWIDILSTVGLDVEDPADVARVAAWQAGAPDELLDNISLDSYLHIQRDPNWALEMGLILREPLRRAQWALLADSLIDMIMEATDPAAAATGDSLRETARVCASLAGLQLGDVPTHGHESSEAFWLRIEDQAARGVFPDRQSFIDGPIREADDRLTQIRDGYWASLDELRTLQTA